MRLLFLDSVEETNVRNVLREGKAGDEAQPSQQGFKLLSTSKGRPCMHQETTDNKWRSITIQWEKATDSHMFRGMESKEDSAFT